MKLEGTLAYSQYLPTSPYSVTRICGSVAACG